jgi:hypothetical protein
MQWLDSAGAHHRLRGQCFVEAGGRFDQQRSDLLAGQRLDTADLCAPPGVGVRAQPINPSRDLQQRSRVACDDPGQSAHRRLAHEVLGDEAEEVP